MSTDFTSVSDLTGLTAVQRQAFWAGINYLVDSLDLFMVTGYRVSDLEVSLLRSLAGYVIKTDEDADTRTQKLAKAPDPVFHSADFENGAAIGRKALETTLPILDLENSLSFQMGRLFIQALVQFGYDRIYNVAYSTDYVGGDGKPLIASDHPTAVGNLNNRLASTLDAAALAAAERQMRAHVGYDGQRLQASPTDLIVPNALTHTARMLVSPGMSVPSSGTFAFSSGNPMADLNLKVTVAQQLSDTAKWFLQDRNQFQGVINVSSPSQPEWQMVPGKTRAKKLLDEATAQVGFLHPWGIIGGGSGS